MGMDHVRGVAMSQYHVKLDVFTGPFDLLLHLIQKHKIDIYDIPIAQIADEFVEYLENAELVDVELAGDFLVMAATLMQIKARMLLPRPPVDAESEEPEDPRSELVERLLEYKRMRHVADILRDRSEYWSHIFTREIDVVIQSSDEHVPDLGGVTASDLAKAFLVALSRAQDAAEDEPAVISRDRLPVATVLRRIRLRLRLEHRVSFFSLFDDNATRELVITAFLAVRELIKLGEITARQSGPFCDIELTLVSSERGRSDEH